MEAFAKGVDENKGNAEFCFRPRHAIRAVFQNQVAEFLICFECKQVRFYFNGNQGTGFLITDSPQKTFDEVLKDAPVPVPSVQEGGTPKP